MSYTVVSVTESQKRGGVKINSDYEASAERSYIVRLSGSGNCPEATALTASGIPSVYAAYPVSIAGAPRLLCKEVKVEQPNESDTTLFVVTASYDNSQKTRDKAAKREAGLEDPSTPPWQQESNRDFSYSFARYEVALDMDLDSPPVPIVNTAGEPFESPPLTEKVRPVVKSRWSVPTFDLANFEIIGKLNNDEITINGKPYNQETARLINLDVEKKYWEQTDSNTGAVTYTAYYDVASEIEIAPTADDWKLNIVSTGYKQLVGGVLVTDKTATGEENTSLMLLDSDGLKTATPYVQSFVQYETADFTDVIPD